MIKTEVSKLLEESPITYYYIGWLLADGCFNSNNSLTLTSVEEDSDKIYEFGKYISCPVKNYVQKPSGFSIRECTRTRVSLANRHTIPLIRNKFDIQMCKTTNPPSTFPTSNVDLLTSMLIGLIDGDGCIYQPKTGGPTIKIECHKSWYQYYILLDSLIFNNPNPISITKRGYMKYCINQRGNISNLLNVITKYKLPVFDRKWTKFSLHSQASQVQSLDVPTHL